MNSSLARTVLRARRFISLLILCGFLSSCGVGWESYVYLHKTQSVPPHAVVAVVGKMKGVSIVSPPQKNLSSDTVLNSVQVKRGNVVAVVMFPTRAGLKNRLTSIVIGTQTQSADGRDFIKELADLLQKRFGDPSRQPKTVRSVDYAGGKQGT
jgi:hypothetical protein